MSTTAEVLNDRFHGCLFGLAVGDALGGRFEAQTAEGIRSRCPTVEALFEEIRTKRARRLFDDEKAELKKNIPFFARL